MQSSEGNTVNTEKTRVTCEENHKLIATVVPSGLLVWCMYHKRAELIKREVCMEAWTKGQSVQCNGEGNDTASTTVA
jgi:hypothetical protein